MRRATTSVMVAAVLMTLGAVHGATQERPAAINFEEFVPDGFSIVVRNAVASADAWADVLGLPGAMVFEPQAPVFPPDFDGDRVGVGPTIALLRMGQMGVTLHQPPPGRNYWRQLLDAHGEVLYRLGFGVHGLAEVTEFFQQRGATLVLGDPSKTPYVNVNLWPGYGFALEINERMPNTTQAANTSALRMIRPAPEAPKTLESTAFARHRVTTIAFVVPNLEHAVGDYAKVFGLSAQSATRVIRPNGFPVKTATLRFSNGVALELNEPLSGQSIWRSHLQQHGRSLFSVGLRVGSVRDEVAYLTRKGGTLSFGGGDAPYAYFDFTRRLGTVIEVRE